MHPSIRPFLAAAFCLGSLAFTACGNNNGDASTTAKATIPDDPDTAIQTVLRQTGEGNTGILWEAMPTSYQTDVNDLAQLAGTKVDPELYDKTFDLIGRIGGLVTKQKAFILNNPQLAEQPDAEKEKIEAALPSLSALLETIATSTIATTEGLQTFEGKTFFETTMAKISEHAMALSKLAEEGEPSMADLTQAAVSVIEREGNIATLEMTIPNESPETQIFKQIEGRWVPAEMADQWSTEIAEARTNLENLTPEDLAAQKPQIMGALTMVDGVIDQLETAESQEEFDQALQSAMMPIMGLLMMGQGMGGGQGGQGGQGGGAAPMPAPAPQPTPAP